MVVVPLPSKPTKRTHGKSPSFPPGLPVQALRAAPMTGESGERVGGGGEEGTGGGRWECRERGVWWGCDSDNVRLMLVPVVKKT